MDWNDKQHETSAKGPGKQSGTLFILELASSGLWGDWAPRYNQTWETQRVKMCEIVFKLL